MSKTAFRVACLSAMIFGPAARADAPETSPAPAKPPAFQVPKGWQAVAAGPVASARYQIGDGGLIGSMTVTELKGDGGGLGTNINRWRAQVGLEPLTEKDTLAGVRPIRMDGISGHSLDLIGPEVTGKATPRIRAAVVRLGDRTWYFKLEGPSSLVTDQKAAFDGFLKSVRFGK